MYLFQDMNQSIDDRVKDLVSRMTLEEKVSQMLHYAPKIERLGIPSYNWWSEALHGVARAGVATVFPQAIGMGATFDENLVYEVANVISDEARAKHHEFVRQGDRDIYKGLTHWSPNINIFRDPRWGRGHETYGEDPYLTGQLGLSFINGLQGDDDKYLKIAACAKHFAVHSGPEGIRHSFDAVVSKKDMYETYLPAFKTCVMDGNVEAVMGGYNCVNGEPACGSPTLLQEILRGKWAFEGHVVSDCWAICDFHLHHKITSTPEESAALAVKSGSDLNCGKTYASLLSAIDQGLLTEGDIDVAVTRLFKTRFKLGMFDSADAVAYAQIPYEINDQESHHVLSLEAARRSMVLLKNQNNILPLNTDAYKSIAVIGPNSDDGVMLLGNYNGTPSRTTTPLRGIQDIVAGEGRVYYAQGCDIANDKVENLSMNNDRIAEAVSAAERSDVAIVCLGLNSQLEGEEGDAGNSRASGDKADLLLPGLQNQLLEAIVATGTPTIAVIFAGSAMDLTWAHGHTDAILQAWYPGPEGGIALADLLFGKVDFSGRLPVTFVKHTDDLPDFEDYSMTGRTYRFIEKDPLYTFGYGLSYNQYSYRDLSISKVVVGADENVVVSVKVTNNGSMAGREVVQVYLKDLEASVRVANYNLVGFMSVLFQPGETRELAFEIENNQMCIVDEAGEYILEAGRFTAYVGGTGPDKVSELLTGKKVLSVDFEVKL